MSIRKIGVGVLLMLWCLAMLFPRDLPQIAWEGRVADGCVGWIGGIMGGLGGLTGPAPILWARLRGWDRHTPRAVFQMFKLCMHCLTMIAYASSGAVTTDLLSLLAVTLPACSSPHGSEAASITGSAIGPSAAPFSDSWRPPASSS